MRLEGIETKEEANRFLKGCLPRHNKRFGRKPAMGANLHSPLAEGFDMDGVLCVKTERALRNDWTVAHEGKLYQILDCVNAKKVIVEERLNDSMLITRNNRALRFKEILSRPEKPKRPWTYKPRKKHICTCPGSVDTPKS